MCSGLSTSGSYLDPLLKNASVTPLRRTTSQRCIVPCSYLVIPLQPLSTLTLFSTSSRDEFALPSPTPSSPFLFDMHPSSTEQTPWRKGLGLQTTSPHGNLQTLNVFSYEPLGRKPTAPGRWMNDQEVTRATCQNYTAVVIRCEMSLDIFGFMNAGCNHVPHNIQEETITWHSYPSATSTTRANSSLIQLYVPYRLNWIPLVP